jgi:3-phenylpropionate/trans-cinnamate dioxygenase ferredoxin reductase component
MATDSTFVVVGASLAGAKAVETLRGEGFDGRIVLIGAEADRPYERPPLSKDYLRGEAGRDKVYVHDEGHYAEHDIDLRTSTLVTELDAGSSEVVLRDGERVGYDRLLLTTGAEPRRLSVDGADLDGVHYLRSVEDSDRLRESLKSGSGRVVVIGAGWIGSEVAASARQLGRDVTLLEQAEVPLERVLGRELGLIYKGVHTDQGVEYLGGAAVERIEGSGSVERVVLGGGRTVDCELVVVGVGVVPRVQLAEAAGIAVDNGVRTTASLETSVEGIYAAGDLANAHHPLFDAHIRVEHWANALNQGPAAARAMLGQEVSYDRVPYFFSDQYDVGMEYSGYAVEWDEVVFRGDVDSREFVAFWLKDGRVLAGMNVNVWDVTDPIQALVRSRQPVDRARLLDSDVALDELASEVARSG